MSAYAHLFSVMFYNLTLHLLGSVEVVCPVALLLINVTNMDTNMDTNMASDATMDNPAPLTSEEARQQAQAEECFTPPSFRILSYHYPHFFRRLHLQ